MAPKPQLAFCFTFLTEERWESQKSYSTDCFRYRSFQKTKSCPSNKQERQDLEN